MRRMVDLFSLHTILFFMLSCDKSSDPISNHNQDQIKYQVTIFKTYLEIFGDSKWMVQDFDLNNECIYIWPIGPYGLYEYNLTTDQLEKLIDRGGGDFIASDSNYVFFAMSGATICERYNIADSSILMLDLVEQDSGFSSIGGMDIYKGSLYVILRKNWDHPEETQILRYVIDGTLKELIPYGKNTIHMAIENYILYSVDISDTKMAKLSRFNLRTREFLEDLPHPTNYPDGIRIYQDKFYFTDYQQLCIGSVSLSEIEI